MKSRAALSLVLLPLATCGEPSAAVPPPVILVTLDTVRADTLSCYGAPPGSTPHLDGFAGVADRYEKCVSAAPWTMPTHASLFTGLYPFEHGAHSFLPETIGDGDNVFGLHPRFETLAEAFAARGYRTAGIVANAHYLRPTLGLEDGFETWDVSREPGGRVTARALAWLDEYGADPRPTFLFVNYMDAHRPYRTGDPRDGAVRKLNALIEQVLVRGEESEPLGSEVRALHQKAVSNLDRIVGTLFDGLKERGLFERSIIVVTSDHGEAFGGHGVVEHSKDVYEDLVRIPLLVKLPGQTAGSVKSERASSVDVAGLVAAALAGTDAESLAAVFPRTPGGHPVVVENHFSRVKDLKRYGERFRRQRRAIYDGPLKLVVGSDGTAELYHVEDDPFETVDLAADRPEDVERLSRELEETLARGVYRGDRVLPGQLDAAQRQEMNALGYGGGDER